MSEGFTGSEADDLLRPVKQWQARQESRDLSKVTIRGLVSKAQSGFWMGGVPPHGYDLRYESDRGEFLFALRFMQDGSKAQLDQSGQVMRRLERGERVNVSKRDRAKLIPSEADRVAAVRRIFQLYVEEDMGLSTVAQTLNREGVPTPRGPQWAPIYCGQWRDSTVRAILVNPIYPGDMVWNRRTDAKFHRIGGGRAVQRTEAYGARLVPNEQADWIVNRSVHPALVSRQLFEKAQAIREGRPSSRSQAGRRRRPVGGWKGARSRFILSGLMRCACCGSRYQGLTRTKGRCRRDGTEVQTRYYACGGYISKGRAVCQVNGVGQEALEQVVRERVLEYYQQYKGMEGSKRLARAVTDHLCAQTDDLSAARARLKQKQEKVQATIARVLDNVTSSTRDLVEERLGDLRRERGELTRRAEQLQCLAAEQLQCQEVIGELERYIHDLDYVLRCGVPDEQRQALRRCLRQITVDKPAGVATLELHPLPTNLLGSLEPAVVQIQLPTLANGVRKDL